MSQKAVFKNKRRIRNYFIKKGLQTRFIFKFCLLLILACVIMSVLVYLLSEKTTTTSFEDLRLTVKSTSDFILPTLILASLIAIIFVSLATVIVFLFISHRIAGPLYRLEKTLAEAGNGDLSLHVHLRKDDELKTLAAGINNMIKNIKAPLAFSQTRVIELEKDITVTKKALQAKGISDDEIERIISPIQEKIERIKHSLSYFKLSSIAIFFVFMFFLSGAYAYANLANETMPSELLSDERWTITKSLFCTVYLRDDVNIDAVNARIDTYRIDYGLSAKPQHQFKNTEGEIVYKLNLIFLKVQEILDMRPKGLHVKVRIYREQDDLDRVYMEIFNSENKFITFYIFKLNTIFSSEEKISANVLAHEIAHAIVDNYFSVIPPPKVAELIAQYADVHLRD